MAHQTLNPFPFRRNRDALGRAQRRPKAALVGLRDFSIPVELRDAVQHYIVHLNAEIERSGFDDLDRASALEEDR